MDNLVEYLNSPNISDLGENAFILLELVKSKKNSRFMDLGVRGGVSSAIFSYDSEKNNNKIHGCDITFNQFYKMGQKFVNSDYEYHLSDSVTLGKKWNDKPFDIIFIDTIHAREQVLAELYFWSNHLNKDGYFVFHDSHWENGRETICGRQFEPIDTSITEFFGLPKSIREIRDYEDENLLIKHCPPSFGMTFVKIKNLNSIQKFKNNIDWNQVFEVRNWMVELIFNTNNKDCISRNWGLNYNDIECEMLININ